MLKSQTVTMKWNSKNKQRYESLGYIFSGYRNPFEVKVVDLSRYSEVPVDVICDYCGRTFTRVYSNHLISSERDVAKKDACKNCLQLKAKDALQDKFGVINNFQREDVKNKITESLYQNGTCPASKPQVQIYNFFLENKYNVELNYPVDSLNLDVALFYKDKKIDIEYDGYYWHKTRKKYDYQRDFVLRSLGWIVLRILSNDTIPKFTEIINTIENQINSNYQFARIDLINNKTIYANGINNIKAI